MSKWFTKNRLAMQTRAQSNLLKFGVTGTSTVDDMLSLDEILEKFNDDVEHSDGISSEMLQAMAAAVVAEMDDVFVDHLVKDAEPGTLLEMSMSMTDVMSGNISEEMANQVTNKANQFFITNPLIVSILQSDCNPKFESDVSSGFKGPNNSMLVGHVDGVRVFSYIFNAEAPYNQGMGAVVVGCYHPENESFTSSIITIEDNGER